ncbi:THO complex subunit 1 transcription elongation factor-domain-containing protein [Stachybotrys elegans]|uniref:THO complex subunit 1 transcription elongation factor-domain-containing protein n=1 Tax=Stachybotrys elegans TaxID=80388 RepID=A0A8K0SID7_9HYPO|nr:THO complex subunit 1 transcription elongation factor-domain-containing protein [Stachybotrys elegans]
MPALDVDITGIAAVHDVSSLFDELLDNAASVKRLPTIEPPLNKSDFDSLSQRLSTALSKLGAEDGDAAKVRRFAVIETAARDLFARLIATTPIESPDFVKMWNFLDIISILSDDGECDPALLFWLMEELLDSQTIAGCRKIFDFLESRRDRITSKHFKQKHLAILRGCNELLRRLSRAEDTAFCGRVFIFLFQSFPLGDRSSVNLRGEYHVENVTAYEEPQPEGTSQMEVDQATPKEPEARSGSKGVSFDAKSKEEQLSSSDLYPQFWSLQETFSQPLKLFDQAHFSKFKQNLDITMKAFQAIHNDEKPRSKSVEDSKRNLKRKRDGEDAHALSESFNPKYLTSKDLFDLEISDLSFRRHVLVQALIIMDFLLFLSPQSKERLATFNSSNKSVTYNEQLSPEDTKWATDMKKSISDYLKQGFEGPYFYRMVETVLARDKNWVFWKMAQCPPIERPAVSPARFVEAQTAAQRLATNKRLRPMPMGAVSLDFLRSEDEGAAMEKLQDVERYQIPELDSFKRKIADDDFEIEMPTNDQTKAAAIAGKSSKSWRALRIASRYKMAAFDKIDDPKKVDIVFEDLAEVDDDEEADEPTASEESMPSNRDALIISGPPSVGKSALIDGLMQLHKGVFALAVRHTTRDTKEGEVNGKSYHFVKKQEFNQLRDGDRLIEYGTRDEVDYGTSSKVIDAITEAGKIPILELDLEAAQFAKDMDFTARYILVKPASDESLQERLEQSGKASEAIDAILKKLPEDLEDGKVSDLFDTSIVNGELAEAVKMLDGYVYEEAAKAEEGAAAAGDAEGQNGDAEMADVANVETELVDESTAGEAEATTG